jgi:hypothetical protein
MIKGRGEPPRHNPENEEKDLFLEIQVAPLNQRQPNTAGQGDGLC